MVDLLDVVKRHGNHHYINVKYGYILLLLIFAHIFYMYISRKIYLKKWITSGRATSFKRLVSIRDYWFLLLWCVVLVGLAFVHFEASEINAFVKRLGRFSYVLVPFDIFLSLKPNPLPNIYYMELIYLHKWISRLIVLLAFIHSLGFIIIWSVKGEFLKIFRILNFLGVISMFAFIISTIVSFKFIRRRFYRTFFTTHLVIAWIIVFLLQFHARPGVTLYTLINLSLIALQILTKFFKSTNIPIEVISHHNSDLKIVQFDNIWYKNFVPASHLRLSYSKKNPLNYLLPSHPYTIASRSDEAKIKLIIKENSKSFKSGQIFSIFGPFPTIYNNFFPTVDKAVLIAGGSGISFALGIYEELIRNSSINVTLIWIIRNQKDLWILNYFTISKIDIYLTQSKETTDDGEFEEIEQLLDNDTDYDDRDSFELNELDPFDDDNEINHRKANVQIKYGRPDLRSYSGKFDEYDNANNWVISCGTSSLNKSCKNWADSLKVRFHSESFDL